MRNRYTADSLFWLQLTVAVFLIALGLVGLVYERYALDGAGAPLGGLFDRGNRILYVAFSIAELAAGLLLVGGLLAFHRGRLLYIIALVILVVWLLRILDSYFLRDIFEPNFLLWLTRLSRNLILAIALWIVARRYA